MTMCQSSGCVSTTSGSQYSEESIAPDVLDGPTMVDPGALSIRLVPKTTPSYPSTNEEGTADYEANRIHQNGITGVSHILDSSTAPQNGDPPMKLYPEPTQGKFRHPHFSFFVSGISTYRCSLIYLPKVFSRNLPFVEWRTMRGTQIRSVMAENGLVQITFTTPSSVVEKPGNSDLNSPQSLQPHWQVDLTHH